MSSKTNSGIQTASDGSTFIPASKRLDGTLRKEIRIRPGFKPSEDIATYKTPTAAAWKDRGSVGVPGAEPTVTPADAESKSKNAKRREAARKKAAAETQEETLVAPMEDTKLSDVSKLEVSWRDPKKLATNNTEAGEDAERQKKIRNVVKKLKAVRELKEKKQAGEKLSPDQLIKIGKEDELVRDLKKLDCESEDGDNAGKIDSAATNEELSQHQNR